MAICGFCQLSGHRQPSCPDRHFFGTPITVAMVFSKQIDIHAQLDAALPRRPQGDWPRPIACQPLRPLLGDICIIQAVRAAVDSRGCIVGVECNLYGSLDPMQPPVSSGFLSYDDVVAYASHPSHHCFVKAA